MKYIKTYEGIFDFFKKKDIIYFSNIEYQYVVNNLPSNFLVSPVVVDNFGGQWYKLQSDHTDELREIEVFCSDGARNTVSRNSDFSYITITKKNDKYFCDNQHGTPNSQRDIKTFNTLKDVCKYVNNILQLFKLTYLLYTFIYTPKDYNYMNIYGWARSYIPDSEYKEISTLVNLYSIMKEGKVRKNRLEMLIDEEDWNNVSINIGKFFTSLSVYGIDVI